MQTGKKILKYLCVFGLTMGLLYGLLVLSAMIPNEAIRENMTKTARHYLETDLYSFGADGRLQNITDNRADQLLINVSWHMGNGNSLKAALDTGYREGSFGLPMGLLRSVIAEEPADRDYSRYWHGSAIFVRAAHLFTDGQGLKALGFAAILLLAAVNLAILVKKKHWDLALCLAISLLMVHVWNLRLSITYQPCFLLALALCPAFVLAEERGKDPSVGLCVFSGAATAFFDFLTTETVSLLLPLILVAAIRCKKGSIRSFRDGAKLLLPCILAWLAAYGGAFVAKWCAVSLVTGQNRFVSVFGWAEHRIVGLPTEGVAAGLPLPIAGVLANLSVLFGSRERLDLFRVFLGVLLWIGLLYGCLAQKRYSRPNRAEVGTLLFLGSLVLLRYVFLSNHAYLHQFFTYRAMVSTVLALLIVLMLHLCRPVRKEAQDGADDLDALPE